MTTTPDPITFSVLNDGLEAYTQIASEIRGFGFPAEVVNTGGNVYAVTVPLDDNQLLVFGGLQDGFAVVDVERDGESFTDGDGIPLTAAACIAAELVRRLNCDDLPASPLNETLDYDAYDALLQQGCEYVDGPASDGSDLFDDGPSSGVAGGQWSVGTYRLPNGSTLTVNTDGTATVKA